MHIIMFRQNNNEFDDIIPFYFSFVKSNDRTYCRAQELFYKLFSKITNKLVE